MNREQIECFKNTICIKCKNKNKQECELHQDIKGNLKCLYEEEEKDEC